MTPEEKEFFNSFHSLISAVSGNSPREAENIIARSSDPKRLVNTEYPGIGRPMDIVSLRGMGEMANILWKGGATITSDQHRNLRTSIAIYGGPGLPMVTDVEMRRSISGHNQQQMR
jgi:hypothetical protein